MGRMLLSMEIEKTLNLNLANEINNGGAEVDSFESSSLKKNFSQFK